MNQEGDGSVEHQPRRFRSLNDLPAEILIPIHLEALNPELALTCRPIHHTLEKSTTAHDKAEWVLRKWKQDFNAAAADLLVDPHQFVPRFKYQTFQLAFSAFVFSQRVGRTISVVKEILRQMTICARSVLHLCLLSPLCPSLYLIDRQTLPPKLVHYLYHQQPGHWRNARTALYTELHRGNIEVVKSMLDAGVIPTYTNQDDYYSLQVSSLRHNSEALEVLAKWKNQDRWDPKKDELWGCRYCGSQIKPELFSKRLYEPAPYRTSRWQEVWLELDKVLDEDKDKVELKRGAGADEENENQPTQKAIYERESISIFSRMRLLENRARRRQSSLTAQWDKEATVEDLRRLWELLRYDPRLLDRSQQSIQRRHLLEPLIEGANHNYSNSHSTTNDIWAHLWVPGDLYHRSESEGDGCIAWQRILMNPRPPFDLGYEPVTRPDSCILWRAVVVRMGGLLDLVDPSPRRRE